MLWWGLVENYRKFDKFMGRRQRPVSCMWFKILQDLCRQSHALLELLVRGRPGDYDCWFNNAKQGRQRWHGCPKPNHIAIWGKTRVRLAIHRRWSGVLRAQFQKSVSTQMQIRPAGFQPTQEKLRLELRPWSGLLVSKQTILPDWLCRCWYHSSAGSLHRRATPRPPDPPLPARRNPYSRFERFIQHHNG
jgi:hypothetical protein